MDYTAIIDQLAEKLAVPAGQLLTLLPQLAIRDVAELFLDVLLVAIGVMLIFLSYKLRKQDMPNPPLAVSGGGLCAIGVIFITCDFSTGVLAITNPQAWALDYILRMIQ